MHETPAAARRSSDVLHGSRGQPREISETDAATRRIRELAERQHGVVSRGQLLAEGFGRGLIQDRLRSGRLVLVHRGVYAVGRRHFSLRERWMAAVLAGGPDALLSHLSAAHLWGMRGSRGEIEITRPSGRTQRPGITVHRSSGMCDTDRTSEAGIPATTIERTLLDIAPRLDRRQLGRALAAADRSGRLSWEDLDRVAAQGACRPGVGRLREVILETDPRAAQALSPLEVDFLSLCKRAGLPLPQVNVLVGGRLVDFLWPDQRVIVETDGYRYHRDVLAFERDHESTVDLGIAGYAVHRATYRMLSRDPHPFLELLRRSLEVRGGVGS